MKELVVSVVKVLGTCTSTPPLGKGDSFAVRNGDIRIPEGRFMCLWALQSILPMIPAKERKIGERRGEDWMWRIHHVQCPDPNGRVVFKIGRAAGSRTSGREANPGRTDIDPASRVDLSVSSSIAAVSVSAPVSGPATFASCVPKVRDLRVVVEKVKGKCTSGMTAGDYFRLEGCRLSLPAGRHFCLYALQAVLPFLAAKQRRLEDGDWLKSEERFICPDPAGNVILRVEIL